MLFWTLLVGVGCGPAQVDVGGLKSDSAADPDGDTTPDSGDATEDTGSTDTDPGLTDPEPPVALITVVPAARVGEAVTFDGSASYDPSGLALTGRSWSCSDGSTGSGASITLTPILAGPLSCDLTVLAASGQSGEATAEVEVTEPVRAAWTVMLFINGDNDLEEYGLGDLEEMEQIGSTDAVNVIVQLDRARGYDRSDGDWTSARRYRVALHPQDGVGSTLIGDIGEVDSGDPQSVVDFAAWAAAAYPADRYALVIWDHGDAWYVRNAQPVKGISWDQQSNSELSIAGGDLTDILEGTTAAIGQPLDLLGMDACIMADWEVAYTAMGYADAFVASQDYEGADGWEYTGLLRALTADPAMDGLTLGDHVASTFRASGDNTQSVTDLAALPALNTALDAVAAALLAAPDGDRIWSDATQDALSFDYENADLGNVLSALAAADDPGVSFAAAAALTAYDNAVTSNYARTRTATGLSIYVAPRRFDSWYLQGAWGETGWAAMLQEM